MKKPSTPPPTHKTRAAANSSASSGRSAAVWVATGLGVGYLPVMPGTYGSALGVALYLGLARLATLLPYPRLFLGLSALAITGASVLVISAALRSFPVRDPTPIVLDEVVGQLLALLPLSWVSLGTIPGWIAIGVGFGLFRALDAIKPYPIWKLGHLHGVWGVVADDLAAGVLVAILWTGLRWLG